MSIRPQEVPLPEINTIAPPHYFDNKLSNSIKEMILDYALGMRKSWEREAAVRIHPDLAPTVVGFHFVLNLHGDAQRNTLPVIREVANYGDYPAPDGVERDEYIYFVVDFDHDQIGTRSIKPEEIQWFDDFKPESASTDTR